MAKDFELIWVCDPFQDDPSFLTKPMFGGMAVYLYGKMVMLLCESPGERSYRNQKYDFDIWDGVMLPTDYAHHEELKSEFSRLVQHPVLKKWLYLPMESDSFDEDIQKIGRRIRDGHPLFGIEPGLRKRRKKKIAKKSVKKKTAKRIVNKKKISQTKPNSKTVKKLTKKVTGRKPSRKSKEAQR